MTTPLISVVIPTRDRPDTLAVCLKAMQREKSRRIEIVVQDNFSGPETAEVVKAAQAQDDRVRYSRAPHPTSQRQSFEFALAATRGDYMSIIGDDDGFAVGSLDWLAKRLEGSPVDAVRWHLLHYVWPSLSVDGEGFMDLYATYCAGGSRVVRAEGLSRNVLRARTLGSWDNLLVYHGMISRRVYDRMRAKTDGVFFAYPMPDVYAHNLIPLFCDTYLQVDDIVSIYGVSGHSAGASWTRVTGNGNEAAGAGSKWMADSVSDPVAAQVHWHPDIRTLRYHDYAALKVAQARGMLGQHVLDDKTWIDAIVAEVRMNPMQITPWLTAQEKAPYDREIFARVRAAVPPTAADTREAQTNRKSADPRIPSLRIKAISPDLPDNVEGAGLALAHLAPGGVERYEKESIVRHKSIGDTLRAAAVGVRHRAPLLSSRVMNSPVMPGRLWRWLKDAMRDETPQTVILQQEIEAAMKAYGTLPATERRDVKKDVVFAGGTASRPSSSA